MSSLLSNLIVVLSLELKLDSLILYYESVFKWHLEHTIVGLVKVCATLDDTASVRVPERGSDIV